MRDALRELAGYANIADHPHVKPMSGEIAGWFRLRVGSYRAILKAISTGTEESIDVAAIGPRGDIYKS